MLRTGCSIVALLACLAAHPLAQAPAPSRASSARSAKPAVTVNINTAGATELQQLPGVGAKTAARIIDYRQKKGPFKKIEELLEIARSGPNSLRKRRFRSLAGVSISR